MKRHRSFCSTHCVGQSFNQPATNACIAWNPIASTYANSTLLGINPSTVFVTENNSVFVTSADLNRIVMWSSRQRSPPNILSGTLSQPKGLFVASTGVIFVDNGFLFGRVEAWTANATNSTNSINVTGSCLALFLVDSNTLYCSLGSLHQVVNISLNSPATTPVVVAGTGVSGSSLSMLNNPYGIFINPTLDLYVADSGNNRIQMFTQGNPNAITVAGNGATGTISLNQPHAVILDALDVLFIADTMNHRIVASGAGGFRCILGCDGTAGSSANELNSPVSLSFDRDGNLFVVDQGNARLQKFDMQNIACRKLVSSLRIISVELDMSLFLNCSLALEVSYNRPRLSRCATWNQDAITVADNGTIGTIVLGIFVNTNSTLYVAARNIMRVQAWLEGSSSPTRNIPADIGNSRSILATINGDIYADNGDLKKTVKKWTTNDSIPTIAMTVSTSCYGLFVDTLNNLYCSEDNAHRVVKKSLNKVNGDTVVVAGNGTAGTAMNMLNRPWGMVVDFNKTLYVADYNNHRVQQFSYGQRNGTTVVGTDAPGTMMLNSPAGLVQDADCYLFIADYGDNRIVGSGPNGFRCIAGCTGISGSASNQLFNPFSMGFDNHGNLFVADKSNNRIQKFLLSSNSCGESFHV